MADVKKYTNQIAKAQKGRDVRDAIVNAINEVSDENNEYNQVKADILSAQSDIAEKVTKNKQTEQTFAADVKKVEELKQGLDTDITQGTALKSQLDAAVETADTSKKNLDASNTTAGQTKIALDGSVSNAQTLKQSLDSDIAQGTTLKADLESDITQGTALKSQLDDTVKTADTSKKNLDASNTAAGKTKTALDVSNTTATKTKADLDASNATASEAKTGLDATNKTAADLVASLGDKITEGTQVKTDIQTTGETAMSNLQAEATKQQEYIKTSIDDTLSISGKAADAAVTGKKIDSLKEDISNKITKFYASNQGEAHITDSDNGKIQDMMLYGKSSQDGTPTPENPVEIKSVVNPTVKVTNEDGLKVQSVTLNNITLNAIPVSSGGNVTIDGKQYIADYVDVERGKYVQMIQTDKVQSNITWNIQKQQKGYSLGYTGLYKNGIPTNKPGMEKTWKSNVGDSSGVWSNVFSFGLSNVFWIVPYENDGNITSNDINAWLVEHPMDIMYPLAEPIETDLTPEENEAFKALVTNYPVTNISVTSDQLDGYTVFNYPISMANGWNYVKQQLNDNRDYIYDMDLQSAEAYVNSEYAVALTELEV